ncbi:MAG: APC family permease [Clostridiales bacterium]|jgi:APA family basic amino acid/polyamine antiporter|nr:APC family permease [Clostridiales bacterium]
MENISVSAQEQSETGLKKKYGFFTAVAMVVGCVVGSGIFFRSGRVINETGGDLFTGVMAWLIGGLIMFVCAFTFSMMSRKIAKANGFIDYSEEFVGKKYSYIVGWILSVLHGPCNASALAIVAANFTAVLFKVPNYDYSSWVMGLGAFYLIFIFCITNLAPKLAGKLQVSTTAIKLVPIVIVGTIGIIIGIARGASVADIPEFPGFKSSGFNGMIAAVVTVSFAYTGWDNVAALNSEIKNPKKTVPFALVTGGILIVVLYVLFFIGIHSAGNTQEIAMDRYVGLYKAVEILFSPAASSIFLVFVIISCLGTCNGYTMACNKHMYGIAVRGRGPKPSMMTEKSAHSDSTLNAALVVFIFTAFWFFMFQFQLGQTLWVVGKDDGGFAPDDLAVIAFYAMCIPLFFMFMVKFKETHWFVRFVLPILAILSAGFVIGSSFQSRPLMTVIYVAVIVLVSTVPFIWYNQKRGKLNMAEEYE